jgi:large subunit ribosomal protein L18
MKNSRNKLRLHRKRRVRAKISGTPERPRLAVFRSLRNISAQVIDDTKGATLAVINLNEIKKAKNDIAGAKAAGEALAKKCLEKKIGAVIFDRSGYKYHGKVKALADGAREGGLKF